MSVPRDKLLCGSWFLIPGPQQWANLKASRTKRMLLGIEVCVSSQQTLEELTRMGVSVIARISDEQFLQTPATSLVWDIIEARKLCNLEAVVMFNEPQAGYSMDYASRSWGNQPDQWYPNPGGKLLTYKSRVEAFINSYNVAFPVTLGKHGEKVGRSGPKLVAGAPPCLTVGPQSKPWPGLMAWNRVLYNALSGCDGSAAHVYGENYHGPVDMERLQYSAQIACSVGNPPYYIEEIGVLHKDPEHNQVQAYIDFCRWLESPYAQEKGSIGTLVEAVIPFVWHGDPQGGRAWPASYLLTRPESYAAFGAYVQNG